MSADAAVAGTPDSICPECGLPLPASGEPCPRCSGGIVGWGPSRTVFLTLCGLLLIPMFTTTGVIVRLFHDKQTKIANDWEDAGEVNLRTNQTQTAIEDFRNALLYAPDNSRLQLELAEALAAQGQLDEAENYLFNLRSADPEDSLIDLELARIAARQGDVEATVGFYHDAAFGQWPDNAHTRRVATRKELIQFLLKHDRQDQGRAEALSLSADNPADPDIRAAAADFLLQAGDVQSAFGEYQHVLRLAPDNLDALVGAGKAALSLYDFADADRYFSRAIQHGSKEPDVAANRDLAAAAGELDPFDARLSDRERQERILEIFGNAELRTKACLPAVLSGGPTVPDNLKALAAARAALPVKLSLAVFGAHPEYANQALSWAFAAEKAVSAQCVGTLADRAIELLASKNKES
jgi:tetratricopeptide (TPR) repeat protein